MSSYSFHGRAVPRLLAESGKLKPEALVTKCKLSLCVPCFKSTGGSKPQETKGVTNASEAGGSHSSLRYSPSGSYVTEMKSVTVDNCMVSDRKENMTTEKASNGSDVQIRLSPAISTSIQQSQPSATLKMDVKPENSANSSLRFLEVKPSWTRTLSIISENETTEVDNHSANGDDGNGQKKVKFPGISPVGSPRESLGSLRRWESQGKVANHRKEDLSRWKRIRRRISKLTLDPLFDMFITFCILVNTVFLSLEYHGMNETFRMALDVGNMVSVI